MKRWMFNVLIFIFAAVFLVSAGVLGKYAWDSHVQKQREQQIAQLVDRPQNQTRPTVPIQTKPVETTVPPETTAPVATVPPEETQPEETEPAYMYDYVEVTTADGRVVPVLRDYAEVFRVNDHLVGWIQIPNTQIDYPVMQTPDQTDYYLHRDFYREYSRHGTIYVRESCDVFAPDDNITIYGHRMKDGSMFFGLTAYLEEAYYRDNRYIYFDTLQEYHTYEILAVFITTASKGEGFRYHVFEEAQSSEEFDEYIAKCKSLALYDTGVTAQYGDKLITLSTCDYTLTNGRLVVVAKRIS